MKHILRKFSRGSILAYSLVLLGIVLVASIGMMAASVTNLKSVSSNDKSINAFQIADSGSQAVIKMLKGAGGSDLGDVTGVTCSGSDAVVESPGNFLGGSYKVTFLNSDGETMKCNGAKGKIADVASVKSVGTYADTARAVQVAVAQSGGLGITGGCTISQTDQGSAGNKISTGSRWGNGCKQLSGVTPPASGHACEWAQNTGYLCGPTFFVGSCSGACPVQTACICIQN